MNSEIRANRQCFFFFFNAPAPTEIYTLSLHDALPIRPISRASAMTAPMMNAPKATLYPSFTARSEEHTSELQSRLHLVCRLLLEKKKHKHIQFYLYKKKKHS